MGARSSGWRAVPTRVALGAALVMAAVASWPFLPHSTGVYILKIAEPAQPEQVQASTRPAASSSPAPLAPRRAASHDLHMAEASTAGAHEPTAPKAAAIHAPAPAPAAQVMPAPLVQPPPARPPPAPAPPAEQLRARAATFRQRLAAEPSDVERAWSWRLQGLRPRGIVVAAGSPGLLANAFVGLFVLRHTIGCTLPIMVM